MTRILTVIGFLLVFGPSANAQVEPVPIDGGPRIVPIPFPFPFPPPPPPPPQVTSDIKIIVNTDDITYATTGTASITLTDNQYNVEATSNYFEPCAVYNTDTNTTGVTTSNIGSQSWGSWAFLAASTQFGNHTTFDIAGEGYGFAGASSRHNFTVSGVGQITITVEYDFFAQNNSTAVGSYASAFSWIDVIAWSDPYLWYGPDDNRSISGTAAGNTQTGLMTTTFNVNGPDSMSLLIYSEANGVSAWPGGC